MRGAAAHETKMSATVFLGSIEYTSEIMCQVVDVSIRYTSEAYDMDIFYGTYQMTDWNPFAAILNPTMLPIMVCVVDIGNAK